VEIALHNVQRHQPPDYHQKKQHLRLASPMRYKEPKSMKNIKYLLFSTGKAVPNNNNIKVFFLYKYFIKLVVRKGEAPFTDQENV